MTIKGIFDKFKDEDYVELPSGEEEAPSGKVLIEIETMNAITDSDRILRKVRGGSILLVKIKELRERDIGELKRAVEKVKRTCIAIDGDIAGIGEDWLVVTPSIARVHRGV